MSGILRRLRQFSDLHVGHEHSEKHNVSTETEQSTVARLVMLATSPEAGSPTASQLAEITRHVGSRRAADAELAVRALSSRLSAHSSRGQMHAIAVTDHLLRQVTEARAAGNVRSTVAAYLVPKIGELAKGRGDDAVRADALRRLEEWAAPTFLNGALLKHSQFADAYRDAAVHTPSPPPPPSAAADVLASNPLPKTPDGDTPLTTSSHVAPLPRKYASTMAQEEALAGQLEVPSEDSAFLEYYSKCVQSFDTLHVVKKVALSDKRIANLRRFLETHLQRVSHLADAHHNKAAMLHDMADHRLRRFPDYRPPATGSASNSPSRAANVPPPPVYAPPKCSVSIPYGREADVLSSTATSLKRDGRHARGDAATAATAAQLRMLRSVANAYGRAPSIPAETPYPAALPPDFSPAHVLDAHGAAASSAAARPPPHSLAPTQVASMQVMAPPVPYYRAGQQQQMFPQPQFPMPPRPPMRPPLAQPPPHAHGYHQYATYPNPSSSLM